MVELTDINIIFSPVAMFGLENTRQKFNIFREKLEDKLLEKYPHVTISIGYWYPPDDKVNELIELGKAASYLSYPSINVFLDSYWDDSVQSVEAMGEFTENEIKQIIENLIKQ